MRRVALIFLILITLLVAVVFAGLDAKTGKVINVADPTAEQDAATKKYVDNQVIAAGGSSQEQTQDWIWGASSIGTTTLITLTYDDVNNEIDFVVDEASIDHDALTNFVSGEHFLQSAITTVSTITSGTWEATDVGVPYGGTGASTLTDGGVLLGSGTGAITAMSVFADGTILIGDGTTDPTTLAAFTGAVGTLKHEYGGLEADVSGYTDGLYGMASGATADIDTIAEIETAIGGTNILIETEIDASSELLAIMDDETGSGSGSPLLVFNQAPTIDSPTFTTAITATDLLTNAHFTHSTDWGDVKTDASGNVVLDDDIVAVAEFDASQDWGDMSTAADGTVSLDNDVVAVAEMADADHGDVAWSGGVASVQAVGNDSVTLTTDTTGNYVASITNGAGISGGDGGSEGAALTLAATLGTDITAAEIANGDHGDFTYSSGSANLDTDVVADNEIDYTAVNMDDMTDGSTNAAVTLTQETNWDTHISSDGTDHTYIDQDLQTTASPTFVKATFSGDIANISTSKTPSGPTDTGTQGDIGWDSSYVYVCVSTDTWKRSALSTWTTPNTMIYEDTNRMVYEDGNVMIYE